MGDSPGQQHNLLHQIFMDLGEGVSYQARTNQAGQSAIALGAPATSAEDGWRLVDLTPQITDSLARFCPAAEAEIELAHGNPPRPEFPSWRLTEVYTRVPPLPLLFWDWFWLYAYLWAVSARHLGCSRS